MTTLLQGTPEWLARRLGRVTSSRIADIVARTKTGYSTSRANYLAQLLSERLTGVVADSFTSPAMQWGLDHEAEARAGYEYRFDRDVDAIGFVEHPSISMSGASPDGLISDDGLIEIKCPNTATHIDTLLTGVIPSKYESQMLWQMSCTGRACCDYVSFDPRLPESMAFFVKRVERNDERLAEIEIEVRSFLGELEDTIERLNRAYEVRTLRAA